MFDFETTLAGYMLVENARGSSVILKRKHTRKRTVKGTSRMRPRRGTRVAPQYLEQIQVILEDGRYANEELGIDIRVDSANPRKFLYCLTDDAENRTYQLVRKMSGYALTGRLAPETATHEMDS